MVSALGVSRTKKDSNTAQTYAEKYFEERQSHLLVLGDGFIIIPTLRMGGIISEWNRIDIFYGLLLELGYVIK